MITSKLFEAFLACPTKCYLQHTGETVCSNKYAVWQAEWREAYRVNGILRLIEDHPEKTCKVPTNSSQWQHDTWDYVVAPVVRVQNLQATPHAVLRQSLIKSVHATIFSPIRYFPENKLSKKHKLLAAFDAMVISKALEKQIGNAIIIHGDKGVAFTIKAPLLIDEIDKITSQIVTVLQESSPPELILNQHCPECEFQKFCRETAVNKNELSLLANLAVKERTRLNRKGIFTVNQLSYTFRPRRRSKHLANKPEKYHHSLKALAIRENKIHVIGNPQLIIQGTPVYFDVEGLPDRNIYYLIGIRAEQKGNILKHYLWSDSDEDTATLWRRFLEILSGIERPVLVHYGSFESKFLQRMQKAFGGPPENSQASIAIKSSINVLDSIYAQIYFPTYSNGLKEIARYLGFEWSDTNASGLLSIAWRYRWDTSHSPTIKNRLITYNSEDCEALSLVTKTLMRLSKTDIEDSETSDLNPAIVDANSLAKSVNSKWQVFKSPLEDLEYINGAAHWDYQRDRVFVRTGLIKRNRKNSHKTKRCPKSAEKVVIVKAPVSCPECGKRGRIKNRFFTRTLQDLVFGRDSLKRRVVQYQFQSYRCRSCGNEYGWNEWYFHARKWGWNVVAYFIYHTVTLGIPQRTVQRNLNRLFGFDLKRSTLNNLKIKAADSYRITKRKILERIVDGNLIHADETRANIKGSLAYVWVITNLEEVVYILSDSREGEVIQEFLKEFKGVLVTDFYTAYDSIKCPQQKCLIHLMRDLNDEILNNPFDQEFRSIAIGFSEVLKPIVETIDRFGLKKRFLRKHLKEVDRFYDHLSSHDYQTEASIKCKQRFEKNRENLFTFLHYDGVPWNNNNAEHAVKAFARIRDVIGGSSTKKGVDEYLTLLSVAETCEYRKLDFLDFLLSEEKDIDTFAHSSGHIKNSKAVMASRDFTSQPSNSALPAGPINQSSA